MVEPKKTTKAATKKEDVKAAVKAETKAAPVKEEVKAAPVKEEALEAAKEEKKAAPAKKPAAKKPAAKKAAEPQAAVHFQFDGKDLVAKDILNRAMDAYKEGHKDAEIKTIELYIVANEGAAYYVVNGEASDDFKILL